MLKSLKSRPAPTLADDLVVQELREQLRPGLGDQSSLLPLHGRLTSLSDNCLVTP